MLHVLILEDDSIIALDIKSIIDEMGGFNTFIAVDMQSALKIAAKHYINIIVSDIQIKGDEDGIETTKRLQEMYDCQAVFLTSFSDEPTLKRVSNINCSSYILKPFREDELKAAVKLCTMKIKDQSPILDIGNGYIYDKNRQLLFCDGKPIVLAPKEQRLFLLLLHSRGNIVPFAYMDEVIWGGEVIGDTTRRQLLFRLKQKLKGLSFGVVKFGGYTMND